MRAIKWEDRVVSAHPCRQGPEDHLAGLLVSTSSAQHIRTQRLLSVRNPRYQSHLTPKLALFCQCLYPSPQVHLETPEEPAAVGARSVACSEEGGVVRDRFKWAGCWGSITTVPTSKYIHRKHSRTREWLEPVSSALGKLRQGHPER